MNPTQPSKRRRRDIQLGAETLEAREMLTGGIGDTIAVITGAVTKAGQPAAIQFTIDPAHFTLPRGKLVLGIDIASASGSTLKPQIASVDRPNGAPVRVTHGKYAPNLPSGAVAAGSPTSAVQAPVRFDHKNPNGSTTYTVKVRGLGGTTGGFLLGFYLPGNLSGSGKVAQADLTAVQSELGLGASSPKYTFDADANRDGRISAADVSVTRQNLGASTTVNPTVTSNLDAASQTMPHDRVVSKPFAHFTGTATPGANVTYQNTAAGSLPVTASADSLGHYAITVPLDPGNNTIKVTSHDAFGQSISGTLAPVTYADPAAALAPPGAAATKRPTG